MIIFHKMSTLFQSRQAEPIDIKWTVSNGLHETFAMVQAITSIIKLIDPQPL